MGRLVRWGVPGLVTLAALYTIGFTLWQSYLASPSLSLNIPSGAFDVAPGTPLSFTTSGWDTQVTGVELKRARLDNRGIWGPSETVPVRSEVQPLDPARGGSVGRVVGEDGNDPVIPDARIMLTLHAIAKQPVFPSPIPQEVPLERSLEFSTRLSPRPELPAKPVSLQYGQDLVLKWSAPMRSIDAIASPTAHVQVALDRVKPNLAHLALADAQEGQEYVVTIRDGVAQNGVALQQPYSLRVITPTSPRPTLPDQPVLLADQRRVTVRWNVPLQTIQGTVTPSVRAHWSIDPVDARLAHLDFDDYAQGQTYQATIVGATGDDGAPYAQPVTFQVQTPAPLSIADSTPADGSEQLSVDTVAGFTFSEPIADRAAAEKAISVSPPTPGHFEWPDDSTVRFVPDQGWSRQGRVSVTLKAVPGVLRGVSGGYFVGERRLAFSTTPDKRIEVSLGEQKMYLWEGNQRVRTFLVATGVRGADTPVGDFTVQYKMATARFRGTNPSGRTYDIPDVRWVLAFEGDYTIHGAYWRTAFGEPGSNGCVSLTDGDAKYVFDWAEEGTPITIHD